MNDNTKKIEIEIVIPATLEEAQARMKELNEMPETPEVEAEKAIIVEAFLKPGEGDDLAEDDKDSS